MTEQTYPDDLVLTSEARDSDKAYFQRALGAVVVDTTNGTSVRLTTEAVAQAHAWLGAFLGLTQPAPEHPPVFASDVPFEDIQAGDTVRQTWKIGGVTGTRTGVAYDLSVSGIWYTEDGGAVAGPSAATIDILARPAKPKLPSEPGAVVLAEIDGQDRVLMLGSVGVWWFRVGGSERVCSAKNLAVLPWRLAKVVEA